MTDGASWIYFADQASAVQAAAEVIALCRCLCQAGHVEDDTIAAPAIGHLDDSERRWVLVISDHPHDGIEDGIWAPCYQIAETHGGEYDTHESGWLPLTPEMRQELPWPN